MTDKQPRGDRVLLVGSILGAVLSLGVTFSAVSGPASVWHLIILLWTCAPYAVVAAISRGLSPHADAVMTLFFRGGLFVYLAFDLTTRTLALHFPRSSTDALVIAVAPLWSLALIAGGGAVTIACRAAWKRARRRTGRGAV